MAADAHPAVVAFDGSEASEAAIRRAVELFGDRGLVVISVWEPGLAYAMAPSYDPSGMGGYPLPSRGGGRAARRGAARPRHRDGRGRRTPRARARRRRRAARGGRPPPDLRHDLGGRRGAIRMRDRRRLARPRRDQVEAARIDVEGAAASTRRARSSSSATLGRALRRRGRLARPAEVADDQRHHRDQVDLADQHLEHAQRVAEVGAGGEVAVADGRQRREAEVQAVRRRSRARRPRRTGRRRAGRPRRRGTRTAARAGRTATGRPRPPPAAPRG